jgi:anti-sigma factor RsiW
MNEPTVSIQELAALVDGELALGRQLELEACIAADPALQAQVQALRALGETVRSKADYHAAPAALRERVLQPSESDAATPSAAGAMPRPAWRWQRQAMALALVGVLVWAGTATLMLPGVDEQLLRDAVASHVRSTLANRLIDVASSDRHTVKPWLSARLDFAPPVKDLASTGATLVGGRVDYLGERPVAALVYRQRQHVVDVFIWPSSERDSAATGAVRRGFNIVHGVRDGMACWAVSDLNRDELIAIVDAQMSER